MNTKPYNKMTPREHIIETVVSRIKCGRATDIHAAIEGYVEQYANPYRVGRLSIGAKVYIWYEDSTYEQRERLIKEIERRVK